MSVSRIVSAAHSSLRSTSLLAAVALTATLAAPASADDYDAAIKDIQSTMGGVPGFVKQFPKAGLPGAWAEIKAIELSDKTALPPKVKSLISLAVAAQIPCNYCIWSDTKNAKRAGATDEEIQEAVAMAALTRHWSTIFNGMQVDFAQFKKDMGGE
ncbi:MULTISPECIES: carboxymuconolactone decarboxylase family protein [unclassified Mesorhizobium]|uniref:carboxymuconolactone decarboxylase family protein n=1 Tax=unclassified Mesorhizobium TaxID=325217 RepID=UPI000FCCA5F3|nr:MULTISPECIES: carboxymuconolactone decarboxylase family protein [unclassified Mesorhizobium]TGP21709.1 carboxymuconolactone decarboxylase family protein [Mesorhizobium sp. M1D.F.Ca.ET.231.01.1.1]TGP29810.1 carboxymuconolactone decarboxylase family protein [Mesorhizobium sp. M1D.F.Ca.ET.234.01.1.1]TGS44174.1 carboxymuconolactone decarboxylase family protein [Mesorhizobium sp. M1D.F.Ca.ET.184.01.1.1]TGS60194.1 carboxymuconolactone decarboxylase family protein [Mesorhizobium sp. M1D.F.Ca.ET.183